MWLRRGPEVVSWGAGQNWVYHACESFVRPSRVSPQATVTHKAGPSQAKADYPGPQRAQVTKASRAKPQRDMS